MTHLDQAGVLELLGDKAEKRRQAGIGECRQGYCRTSQRHEADQTAQACQLAGAGGVVDGADRHEQRAFIERMRHQIEHKRLQAIAGVGADQHGQLAQHGHRGVRQQALEVGLAEGEEGAEHRSGCAEGNQQGAPADGAAKHRVETGQQVDTGFYHGRRMQIGRHRSRCVHRIGQPQMEGHLRRFGEAAQQYQGNDRRQQHMAFDLLGAEIGELPVARRATEQDQSRQQRQATAAGDQQRLQRRTARYRFVVLKTDQQEGGDTGQLPEHEHRYQVVGQHQAEHRQHEHQQVSVKATQVGVAGQITAGVQHDQAADAADQQGKNQRETVQAQAQIDTQCRNPAQALHHGAAAGDQRNLLNEPDEGRQRRQHQQPTCASTQKARQAGCHDGSQGDQGQ